MKRILFNSEEKNLKRIQEKKDMTIVKPLMESQTHHSPKLTTKEKHSSMNGRKRIREAFVNWLLCSTCKKLVSSLCVGHCQHTAHSGYEVLSSRRKHAYHWGNPPCGGQRMWHPNPERWIRLCHLCFEKISITAVFPSWKTRPIRRPLCSKPP